MVAALQRPEIVLRHWRAAADQQYGHALEVGVGDRHHAVGDPRTGSCHRDAHAARELRVRKRHAHCRALVPHVDDLHAELRQMVPDRLDVPTLQAKDAVNAAGNDEARNDLGDAATGGETWACCATHPAAAWW